MKTKAFLLSPLSRHSARIGPVIPGVGQCITKPEFKTESEKAFE